MDGVDASYILHFAYAKTVADGAFVAAAVVVAVAAAVAVARHLDPCHPILKMHSMPLRRCNQSLPPPTVAVYFHH